MPSGKDVGGLGRRGAGGTTKKNAFCSFCRKSYRDVGPLVEGPGDVYICGECIELCQSILDQEKRRRGTSKQLFTAIPSPRAVPLPLDGEWAVSESVAIVLVLAAVLGVAIVAINRIRARYLTPGDDRGDWERTLVGWRNLRDEGVLTEEEYRKLRTLVEPRVRIGMPDPPVRRRPAAGPSGPDHERT